MKQQAEKHAFTVAAVVEVGNTYVRMYGCLLRLSPFQVSTCQVHTIQRICTIEGVLCLVARVCV